MRKLVTLLLTGVTSATLVAGTAGAGAAAETPSARSVAVPAAPAVRIGAVTLTTWSGSYLPPTTLRLAAAKRCWYHHTNLTAKIKGTNTKLFVFETIVNWCGKKKGKMSKITYKWADFTHLNSILQIKEKPSSKIGKPSAKHWNFRAKAKVSACVAGVCGASWYPWTQTEMYGNGKRSAKGGW